MTDWNKVAPKRAENAIKALALVAKTAGRAYDVPATEAAQMVEQLRAALDDVQAAFEARGVDPGVIPAQSDPGPQPKRSTCLRETPHIQQIAEFVADLPSEHLPSYITHLVNRLCEQADAANVKN